LKKLKTERQQQAPVLDQVKALDLKITGLQAQQEKQQAVLLTARQALEDTLKEITAVGLKLATAEKEAEAVTVWMEQNSNWAALAEDLPSIREQRQQLIESFQEEKQARAELSQKQNARKEQAAKLETSEKEVAALSAQLQATKSALAELAPKSFASTPNDLLGIVLEEIADLSNRQQQLKQLQGFSQQYEKLLAVQDQLEAELEQLQTRDRLLNTQVLGTVDQLDELQRTRAYRNEIYEQQQRIANYEKDRSTLKEGDPCPLCLSTTHPFRENGIKPFVDEAKAELKRVEGKIEGVQQHQRQLLKEQQEIELRIQQLQGDEKATIAGQIEKQLKQLIGYEEQISVIKPEEGQWEKADSLNAEIGQIQDQLQQREKDRKEIGQLVKRLNEQEARFNKVERSHQDTAAEQRVLDHSITHLTEEQQKKKKKFEQGTARINQLLARYNFTFELDTAKQMFKSLEERRAQWAEKNEQSVTLSKSIALLQSQMKQLSRQEEERKASLVLEEKNGAETGAELNQLNEERKALFGDQDPELVAQALRQSIEAAEQKREHSQKAESDALQSLITAQSQLEEKSARQASQKG
ncbi:MAG: hypothetical protein HRU12_12395, partial [Phaeodactylibacter sp.]|nr:hypothetical protein [Phaeodactylibacter sp.]